MRFVFRRVYILQYCFCTTLPATVKYRIGSYFSSTVCSLEANFSSVDWLVEGRELRSNNQAIFALCQQCLPTSSSYRRSTCRLCFKFDQTVCVYLKMEIHVRVTYLYVLAFTFIYFANSDELSWYINMTTICTISNYVRVCAHKKLWYFKLKSSITVNQWNIYILFHRCQKPTRNRY